MLLTKSQNENQQQTTTEKKELIFKKVTLEDKELICSYLKKVNYRICDLSFTNIFAWRSIYNTCFAIVDDFLVLRSGTDAKNPAFLMPVGKGDLKAVLLKLIAHAKENGFAFKFASITKQMQKEIEEVLPNTFDFIDNRDYCDYLYESESLSTFKGKKLHAKRNHVNKFQATYNYEYVDITQDNLEQCRAMHDEWCAQNDCDGKDQEINDETCAVRSILNNFAALDVVGGALLVDGKMVAFTIGSKISEDTFDVHVEKALPQYNGVYSVICQMFAQKNKEGNQLINREEDLGKEGLRKSKLSYHPYELLCKDIAVLKQ